MGRDKKDTLISKAALNVDECRTDHRLLVSRLRAPKYRKPRSHFSNPTRRKFSICNRKNKNVRSHFQDILTEQLNKAPATTDDVEQEWTTLKNIIKETAENVVGLSARKRSDWFDDNHGEIQAIVNAKRDAYLSLAQYPSCSEKKAHFQELKQKCQSEIRAIKNKLWQQKATEVQNLSDARNLRGFYAGIKELYGPIRSSSGTLKAADNSTILTESQDILNRWKEHFSSLLNGPSTAAGDFLKNDPQQPPQSWMADTPTFQEFCKALNSLKPGKAPGPDSIPMECIEGGGLPLKTRLFSLILLMWETRKVPADLKNSTIVTIFKKGYRSVCGNYWGISLLSASGKIFARILLNRLQTLSETILPESQCGFRPSRGTIDMIFCAQLQEKCREQQKPLLLGFYHLEKAFDTVPREAMWMVLKRFGCPEHFGDLIKALHDDITGQVLCQNETTGEFPITSGLKQGCVLAPTHRSTQENKKQDIDEEKKMEDIAHIAYECNKGKISQEANEKEDMVMVADIACTGHLCNEVSKLTNAAFVVLEFILLDMRRKCKVVGSVNINPSLPLRKGFCCCPPHTPPPSPSRSSPAAGKGSTDAALRHWPPLITPETFMRRPAKLFPPPAGCRAGHVRLPPANKCSPELKVASALL
ncbi:uncharacterized protein LOC126278782 [Schistocerca gregaria]|uniref:uncharacterized protein LOC126278782 n=1 Tax=Schistocerca gregaria TaxID=7010 RepID=UPI00211EC63B|nr:uncharacterized protein LOC126278782 [Schistocerca gregaria]